MRGSGEVVGDTGKNFVFRHDFGLVMAPGVHQSLNPAVNEMLDRVKREIFGIVGGGGEAGSHERGRVAP